jgi:hypothetical protein
VFNATIDLDDEYDDGEMYEGEGSYGDVPDRDNVDDLAALDPRFVPGHPASLPRSLLTSLEFFTSLASAEKQGSFIRLLRQTFEEFFIASDETAYLTSRSPLSVDVALRDMFDTMIRDLHHQFYDGELLLKLGTRAMGMNEAAIVESRQEGESEEEEEEQEGGSTIIRIPASAFEGIGPRLPKDVSAIATLCQRSGNLARGRDLELWSAASRVFTRSSEVFSRVTGVGAGQTGPTERGMRTRLRVSAAHRTGLTKALTTPLFLIDLRDRQEGGVRAVVYEASAQPQVHVVSFSQGAGCSCPTLDGSCMHRSWMYLAVFRTRASDPIVLQRALLHSEIIALVRRRLIRTLLGRQTMLPVLKNTLGSTTATPLVPINDCIVCQRPTARGAHPTSAVPRAEQLWWCSRGCGTPVHLMCVRLWNEVRKRHLNRRTDRCPTCRTPVTAPTFRLRGPGEGMDDSGDPMVRRRGGASDVETDTDGDEDDNDEGELSMPMPDASLSTLSTEQSRAALLRQQEQLQQTLHL